MYKNDYTFFLCVNGCHDPRSEQCILVAIILVLYTQVNKLFLYRY